MVPSAGTRAPPHRLGPARFADRWHREGTAVSPDTSQPCPSCALLLTRMSTRRPPLPQAILPRGLLHRNVSCRRLYKPTQKQRANRIENGALPRTRNPRDEPCGTYQLRGAIADAAGSTTVFGVAVRLNTARAGQEAFPNPTDSAVSIGGCYASARSSGS